MSTSILDRILVTRGILFPVGSYVFHPSHGTGLVLARVRKMASIEFVDTQMTPVAHLKPDELPPDVDPELLLAAGTETRWTVDLTINELVAASAPSHWTDCYRRR